MLNTLTSGSICLAEYVTRNRIYLLHHLCDYLGNTNYTLHHTLGDSLLENELSFDSVDALVDHLLITSLELYKHSNSYNIHEDIQELITFLEERKWSIQ